MSRENVKLKICCITIGNEILLGKTINTNLAYIGRELTRIGLYLASCITIPDEAEDIQGTFRDAWAKNDIIITTGGLGPTSDDITKKEIARFFGKELEFADSVWKEVQTHFRKRGISIPNINRNQAEVPKDFTILSNIYGTAPGLYYVLKNKHFFALPGVPLEMKHLFSEHIIPLLQQKFPRPAILMRTIHTYGIAESAIAELMADYQTPKDMNLAYLPQTGRVDLRIYGTNHDSFKNIEEYLKKTLAPYIWGYDDDEPDTMLHREMLNSGKTLALAESCTGGLVQEMLTRHADSSVYFIGGVVSYSNNVKHQLLDVSNEDLEKFGAVSKEIATEMAAGIRSLLYADICAAITGIAGPGGGTIEKPVGTVHITVSNGITTNNAEMHFTGDRDSIRQKAAEKCIFMLYELIKK
jgi:nicotinamide-nucleotide amidase